MGGSGSSVALGATGNSNSANVGNDVSAGTTTGVAGASSTSTGSTSTSTSAAGNGTATAAGGTGSFISVGSASQGGFIAVRALDPEKAIPGQSTKLTLPSDTFRHAEATTGFRLEARQADGSPLPTWVTFDPNSGVFVLRPPLGTSDQLQVTITAIDSKGNAASAHMSISLSDSR